MKKERELREHGTLDTTRHHKEIIVFVEKKGSRTLIQV